MAESIKITQNAAESVHDFGREHSEKLQTMARSLLSSLYMLVRSVKMYDPDNAVFTKPLTSLQDTINQIIGKESRLDLMTVKESFYLNDMLVKVDLSALDNTRYLISELQAKDVGGFSMSKSVQMPELKNFIWIFSKEQTANTEEDGVSGRKLLNMKVTRWSKLKEKLERDELNNPDDQKVDRKKYAMTIYARAIFYVTRYLDSVRAGKPMTTGKATRLVQDLVDICFDQHTHFLGMTTLKKEQDYLVYHQVNVCLMAIVFGQELGLTKPQLLDLGYAALFHDAGMATIPDQLASKKGSLTPEERLVVQRAPLLSVRNILMEKGISRAALLRIITTSEHKTDFGTAVRDPKGNIQMIIPKSNLGLYARIIAICATFDALTSKRPFRDAYGPDVALLLMWTELRHKFDPDLLKVFMKVMAIQPVKILNKRQRNISLSGA